MCISDGYTLLSSNSRRHKMSSENIYLHMISFQGIYQLYIQIQYSNARQWLELALQSENESYSSS